MAHANGRPADPAAEGSASRACRLAASGSPTPVPATRREPGRGPSRPRTGLAVHLGRGVALGRLVVPSLLLIAYLIVFTRVHLGHHWQIFRPGLVFELALLVYLSLGVHSFQRRQNRATALFLLLGGGLYTVVFVKYAFFREPPKIFDLWLLDELVYSVSPTYVALFVAAAAGMALVVAGNWRWPKFSRQVLVAPLAVYLLGTAWFPGAVRQAFDTLRPPLLWRVDHNSFRNGPLYGLLRDAADGIVVLRELRRGRGVDPGPVPHPLLAPGDEVPLARRSNVHLVVLESFLDPLRIENLELPFDPIDPRLRRWLDEGRSAALAAGFGVGSPWAEFELVCGLPAYRLAGGEHGHFRGAPVPCLPRILGAEGYRTMVTNLSPSDFYNYAPAYRSMGFSDVHFLEEFDVPAGDFDGAWVASERVFGENLKLVRAALAGGEPLFNYVVTGSGHEPYELDPVRRPPVLPLASPLHKVANAAHYNSAATADLVTALEELDPDGIIVVTADHPPPIGRDYRRYQAEHYSPRGRMLEWQSRFIQNDDRAALDLRRVELLIRHRGRSLPVGIVPHFAVPEIVLDLLAGGELCRRRACLSRREIVLRPLGRRPVFSRREGFPRPVCERRDEGPQEPCRAAWRDHDALLEAYRALMYEATRQRG